MRIIKTKSAEKTRSQNMHSSQSYGQNTVTKFQIHRGDPVKWKILNTILSISLVWRHILTSSLFCSFCFDNTQLLAPIFWNLEELYFSLPEGEVRFLKSACTNSHRPKKYFMSLFVMWDGKEWISHAQPMTILKSPTLSPHLSNSTLALRSMLFQVTKMLYKM